MKYTNIVDMHTHSDHSFDGNDSCIELCENAISNGAMAIAITDHCDIDGADMDVRALCSNQFVETAKVKSIFRGDLLVIQGLEIGQGIYRKNETEQIFKDYPYDFILGSLHNLENMEDFYFLDYKQYDVYELLQRYFEGLLELSQWGAFDSLAHLTYPLRYIIAREKIDVDMTRFSEIIDAIFEALI
ncbi:MAG: PHP domain-containing protein, partial [Eubacterium sp.]